MLVVTDIKVVEVNDNHLHYIYHQEFFNKGLMLQDINDPNMTKVKVTQEQVHGQEFVDNDGRVFTIGWSEAAQKAFSLPFEELRHLRHDNIRIKSRNSSYAKKYDKLKQESDQRNEEQLLQIAELKLALQVSKEVLVDSVIDKITKD